MIKIVTNFLLVLFFILLFLLPGYAQYQINHFTTENGLPSNGIKGLQLDKSTGFLWIATEAGLVRYNGMGFTTFDINTNPDLGSNRLVLVKQNTNGTIITGGEKGNLLAVKGNVLVTWLMAENTAQYNYNYFGAITASDTLFRQCFKNPWSIYKFTVHYNTVVPLSDTACVILADWQLYYYSISTLQPEPLPAAPENIKSVFKLGDQLYCLNASGVLFLFDVYEGVYKEVSMKHTEGSNFVLKQDNSSLFWEQGMEVPVILQDQNAWVIEPGTNANIQCRLVASGIPGNTFFNFAQFKKEGNYLFLGSASKGIYIISKNQLVTKKPAVLDINQHNSFYSQVELPDGNIITNEGIIIGDAPGRRTYNISPNFLNNVYTLNDSLLIYANRDSIYRYSKKTYNRNLILVTPVNNFCLAISGKLLYIANQDGIGIIRENATIGFLKRFDEKTAVHIRPYSMIEMAPGKLAIATCEGLLGFDTKTTQVDTLLKLPSVCIRTLHREGDYIFIGTYGGGFYIMKKGKLKAMPLDVNGFLKYTHCFMKDDRGFYWISTNNGLFKVKMSDLIDAYESNLPQIYYHHFGKADGMETTEMNGGCTPCAIRLKSRDFSFPTMDGLIWFNPEKVTVALPSGDIFIDQIMVDGVLKSTVAYDPIQLPERSNRIEITLAVNAWCKKENLYIDYRLNDDQWQRVAMVSNNSVIGFSNLSYGKYVLHMRKLNGFGVNNYSYQTIAFTIATPFYHQWWFRIFVLLVMIGVGYLVFRLRLRQYDIREKKLSALVEQKTMDLKLKNSQLEKNDQVKTRLISVINHDIITPLKFMHYAGKALVENKGTIAKEEQQQTISEITQTAKDMEMLSSQILNWIIYQNPNERMQKEEFDLHHLVEMIFRVLQFSARQNSTKLKNDIPVNFVVNQYLEPLRVMIYNLVLNSLNFTKDGLVNVACGKQDGTIIISVHDNGVGMTTPQIENILQGEKIITSANIDDKKGTGLGYLIIKDLIKMMKGTINIKSNKGEGTTVEVLLPEA